MKTGSFCASAAFRKKASLIGYEVLTAVVMKVAISWNIAQCRFLANCWFIARQIFYSEDRSDTFLRNVGYIRSTCRYISEEGNFEFIAYCCAVCSVLFLSSVYQVSGHITA
jgi:hypothetical protein